MLYVNLKPEFRAGAMRSLRNVAPAAESLRLRLFKGLSTAAVGAILGWGGVVGLGAILASGVSRQPAPSAPAVAAVAAPSAPSAVPAPPPPAAPKEAAAAPTPAPGPPPAPTKTTQRVDMSPTAAIVETPKPHKKPHKKKPLDNAN